MKILTATIPFHCCWYQEIYGLKSSELFCHSKLMAKIMGSLTSDGITQCLSHRSFLHLSDGPHTLTLRVRAQRWQVSVENFILDHFKILQEQATLIYACDLSYPVGSQLKDWSDPYGGTGKIRRHQQQ